MKKKNCKLSKHGCKQNNYLQCTKTLICSCFMRKEMHLIHWLDLTCSVYRWDFVCPQVTFKVTFEVDSMYSKQTYRYSLALHIASLPGWEPPNFTQSFRTYSGYLHLDTTCPRFTVWQLFYVNLIKHNCSRIFIMSTWYQMTIKGLKSRFWHRVKVKFRALTISVWIVLPQNTQILMQSPK